MNGDKINTQRSNIKYKLCSLFSLFEEQKEYKEFIEENCILSYDATSGLLLKSRNPDIKVTHEGVELPIEYTSMCQIPYKWIDSIINKHS